MRAGPDAAATAPRAASTATPTTGYGTAADPIQRPAQFVSRASSCAARVTTPAFRLDVVGERLEGRSRHAGIEPTRAGRYHLSPGHHAPAGKVDFGERGPWYFPR